LRSERQLAALPVIRDNRLMVTGITGDFDVSRFGECSTLALFDNNRRYALKLG
jgi:hypothetical protein